MATTYSHAFDASSGSIGRFGITPSYGLPLALLLSWLLPAGPFTALIALAVGGYAAYTARIINAAALRLAAPFLVMVAYATLLASGHDRYDIARDVWYGVKLCLCLTLGLLMGARETDARPALRIFTIFAIGTAAWTVGQWAIFGAGEIGVLDPDSYIEHVPLVSMAAIPMLLDGVRTRRPATMAACAFALAIILFAVLVSQSRITILAALGMALAWAGLFANWRRTLIGGLVVAVVGVAAWQFLPEYTGGQLTVAMKFRRSLDEMQLTNPYDMNQVYMNWRGFEAYNAQLMFDNFNLLGKLFGAGMGATIDLGMTVQLGPDVSYRFLPILHNGFYYILIKYGIIGVAIYSLTVLSIIKWGRLSQNGLALEDRMLTGLVLCIFLSTAVITGLYNKSALHGVVILTAWLVGHACRRRLEFLALPSSTATAPSPSL